MAISQSYFETILEDINGKFDFLVDAIASINEQLQLKANQSDLEEVKADVKTIKLVVTSHADN